MGETTKCEHCGTKYNANTFNGYGHIAEYCRDALRARLSAAERERDEAVDPMCERTWRERFEALTRQRDEAEAWKKLAISEAVRWAERDVVPLAIGAAMTMVPLATYEERARALHLAAGAVKALEAEVLQTRAAVVRESLAKDAAFARGVESAAKVLDEPRTWLMAYDGLASKLNTLGARIRALAPAPDAGKETT